MKILVTGASGFVGTHLSERLLKEGHEVFALVRTPKKFSLPAHDRLHVIQGDINSEVLSWTANLPNDLDTCVHTAGIVHSYNTDEFYHVNADGTEYLVNNLKKHIQKLHFILISSLAGAGPSLGNEKRTELDMDFPVSIYGKSKKKAEEVLSKNAPATWQTSVVRPPMVIGPGDAAVLDIFKMVKGGVVILPGKGAKEKLYSFVCVFDLVETITLLISQKKPGIYYSSHPQTVTFEKLIGEVKKQLKQSWLIFLPLPLFMVRLLTVILDLVYRIRPHGLRLTPDKIHEIEATNWTCDGTKSEVELGQTYAYDIDRTITVTLLDYKARKWI